MFRASSRSATFVLLALYAAVVLVTLGWTPLWLDEVQQFGNTRHSTVQELLRWVQLNAGASPLPYLAQRAAVNVLGYSAFAARLPAAVCGILSGVVFAALCSRFLVRGRWIAVALFLALPLQFRYGLEARVYSQGLLFSLVAMWLFLRLRERSSPGLSPSSLAVLYGMAVAVGIYSQPLTCFPALAHVADGRTRRYVLPAITAAGLSFLPWYVLQRQAQAQYALSVKPIAFFSFRQVMPQVLLHDLTGGGYACTAALLLLAGWAIFSHAQEPLNKRLLLYTVAISLAGPILMDILFNYFFADRQILFALPALIVLAGLGFERLCQQRRATLGYLLLAVFLLSAAVKDFRLATVPKDDLARTADTIVSRLPSDACILTAPPEHVAFYAFLRPELEARACLKDRIYPTILAVTSSYTTPADRKSLGDSISPQYEAEPAVTVGQSELTLYRRH
jgi:4-amino-4-deoxy-L-arabinose transferase-like glycosyltransferase